MIKTGDVRYWAASALGSAFSQVPDKQQTWNDLHELTNDKDSSVRYGAASNLGLIFLRCQISKRHGTI